MYINIKGTDVFVKRALERHLDGAAQIATNYYDKLKLILAQPQIVQLELLGGLMKGFRYYPL